IDRNDILFLVVLEDREIFGLQILDQNTVLVFDDDIYKDDFRGCFESELPFLASRLNLGRRRLRRHIEWHETQHECEEQKPSHGYCAGLFFCRLHFNFSASLRCCASRIHLTINATLGNANLPAASSTTLIWHV